MADSAWKTGEKTARPARTGPSGAAIVSRPAATRAGAATGTADHSGAGQAGLRSDNRQESLSRTPGRHDARLHLTRVSGPTGGDSGQVARLRAPVSPAGKPTAAGCGVAGASGCRTLGRLADLFPARPPCFRSSGPEMTGLRAGLAVIVRCQMKRAQPLSFFYSPPASRSLVGRTQRRRISLPRSRPPRSPTSGTTTRRKARSAPLSARLTILSERLGIDQ